VSRLDLLRSLLRSTARGAGEVIASSPLSAALRKLIEQSALGLGRVVVRDEQLTAAVARGEEVSAATVRSGRGCMRVDVSFSDGELLRMAFWPEGAAFAPLGAKELSFRIEPHELAQRTRSRDVLGAIAGEIARSLWRPALARAPRSTEPAIVSSDRDRLIVDLRSVPEVRWAMRQRVYSALVELLRPRALEVGEGSLTLLLALEGLGRR
jgi:hypothetical protein